MAAEAAADATTLRRPWEKNAPARLDRLVVTREAVDDEPHTG